MKKKRPVLIGVISILNIIGGVIVTLASLGVNSGAEGAFLCAIGLLGLVVGVGLFKLCSWARKAAIAGYIINGIAGLAEANIIMLVIASLILTYLFSKGVKKAFSKDVQSNETAKNVKKDNKLLEAVPHSNIG